MKKVITLAEATAHFEENAQTILCCKDGFEPQECSNLGEAREFYGFTPSEEPIQTGSTVITGDDFTKLNETGSQLPPVEQTGNTEQVGDPMIPAPAPVEGSELTGNDQKNEAPDKTTDGF